MVRQVIALQPRRDDVLLLSRQFSERLAGNLSQMNDLAILLRLFCLSDSRSRTSSSTKSTFTGFGGTSACGVTPTREWTSKGPKLRSDHLCSVRYPRRVTCLSATGAASASP